MPRVILVLLFLAAFNFHLLADCVIPPPCHLLSPGSALFVGEILDASPVVKTDMSWKSTYRVRIVEQIWGIPKGQKEIFVVDRKMYPGDFRDATGRWLFAGQNVKNDVFLDSCDYPQRPAAAKKTLEYLRAAVAAKKRTSLELRVYSITGGAIGATISLRRGAREYSQTVKAREEKLLFRDLRPGHYSIDAHLAKFYWAQSSPEVDLAPGGCPESDIRFAPDNVVSGLVVDLAGQPVVGIAVGVTRRELHSEGFLGSADTRSGADGSFRIRGITPGAYWLAANTGWIKNPAPFAPVLLDGDPLQIAMDSHIEGQRLVAGEQLTPRKLVLHLPATGFGGTLTACSLASPMLTYTTTFGTGGDLELPIFRELGYRLQIAFKKQIDIPPGDQDVELTIK